MAELATIARPYAEAAFKLALEEGDLEAWRQMLLSAAGIVRDGQIRSALGNPKLDNASKESLLFSVMSDQLQAMPRRFIRVLIESDRITLLPQIAEIFDELKNVEEGVAIAHIASAFEMTEQQLSDLRGTLEAHFGKKVETVVVIDPALIGGARIRVGDRVIDASVAGKLQAMSSALRS